MSTYSSAQPTDAEKILAKAIQPNDDSQDLERLRLLLLGSDYIGLLALKNQLQDVNQYTARVASVLAEAIKLRSTENNSALSQALLPSMEEAIERFITSDPQKMANVLYPVMGPAIRKSIHETLNQTLETFNQLLEQSLSPKSLSWRFDAWRTGRKYSEVVLMKTLVYQVEQVFLIHRETSLLLNHIVSEKAIAKDPDMVSSMLSAIQDFMADSFTDESSLNALRLGDLNVLIEQSPYVAIAAVVRGVAPANLRSLLIQTLETVHQRFEPVLKHYDGNSEAFASTQPLLAQCLQAQRQGKNIQKKRPWLAYSVLGLAVAGLSYWSYNEYLERQQLQAKQQLWQQTLAEWNALEGIVILDHQVTANGHVIRGLKDPLATDFTSTLSPQIREQFNPTFEWQAYLSTEPSLTFQRVKQFLNPPQSVELNLEGSTLKVSGTAPVEWVKQLNGAWLYGFGLIQLDLSQLVQVNAQAPLQQMIQAITQTTFFFEQASPVPIASSTEQLPALAEQLKKLKDLATQQQLAVQVTIIGGTDSKGALEFNRRLGLARAQSLVDQLLGLGVPQDLLVAAVSATSSSNGVTAEDGVQRSVTFKVVLEPVAKPSG
jgi:OOP family OmpA-OmpF porin